MVKALPKSPLKSRQVNVNFHGHFGTGIKTPAIPRHCGDNAEVKTLQLSPAMPPLFPAPRGLWLQMTGALLPAFCFSMTNAGKKVLRCIIGVLL